MGYRSGWLFPLMVVAAGSVTAFGCIGLAAITGHLALTRGAANPLGEYPAAPEAAIEQALTPQAQPAAVVVVDAPREATKPNALSAGKPVAHKRSSEQGERTLN